MSNYFDVAVEDIFIKNGKIDTIGKLSNYTADEIIDLSGKTILPGFIQTHIHLCQTMFRGTAEDLALLDWLKKRIWKLEAEHTKESMYYSALLGISELISCGTTTILDMGSTHHYEQVFLAAKDTGIRFVGGKAIMDFGEGVPDKLGETTEGSLQECVDLIEKWHNSENGRLKYALAPRFLLSCTDEALIETGKLAKKYAIMIHNHASENKDERKIYTYLGKEPSHLEQIIIDTQISAGSVNASLISLRLKGLIKQLPGNLFVKI